MDPVNATNITLDWAIQPLYDRLGEFAMPFIFGLGLAILWSHAETDKLFLTTIYLIIVGVIGSALFGDVFHGLLILGAAFGIGTIFYLGLMKKGWNM